MARRRCRVKSILAAPIIAAAIRPFKEGMPSRPQTGGPDSPFQNFAVKPMPHQKPLGFVVLAMPSS